MVKYGEVSWFCAALPPPPLQAEQAAPTLVRLPNITNSIQKSFS
jgi:hypothetical protein